MTEKVVLAFIDTYFEGVKRRSPYFGITDTPLGLAQKNGLSEKVIKVLQTLVRKSYYDLEKHINTPMIVVANGVGNRPRQDGSQ
jgi:hypothetical protein